MEPGTGEAKSRSFVDLTLIPISYQVVIGGAVLLAAIVVISSFLLSGIARDTLIRVKEDETRNLAEHLTHTFFPAFTASHPEEEFGRNWEEAEWQESLDRLVRKNLPGLDIVKVKIFDLHGRIIYSTDPGVRGAINLQNLDYRAALEGTISSRLEHAR